MAPNPRGTSAGTPSPLTDTVWSSCTSVICSLEGSGSFSSSAETTVRTSGAVRFSGGCGDEPSLDALAAPPLAAGAFEPSTQRPVNGKHTGAALEEPGAAAWTFPPAWVPDVGVPLLAPGELEAAEDGFAD